MSGVGDYDDVPPWKFGDVLRHTLYPGALLLFLGWTYTVGHNWHESIFKGLCLANGGDSDMSIGSIYEPYCGWYRPVEGV